MNPIIHEYLTRIMVKHYNQEPTPAAQQATKLLEIFRLYDMQLILGEWTVPEKADPKSAWEIMAETARETMEREPWLAVELRG